MASGLDHPKVTLHVGDGFQFMQQHCGQFDVIITDSSDPVGESSVKIRKKKKNIKLIIILLEKKQKCFL